VHGAVAGGAAGHADWPPPLPVYHVILDGVKVGYCVRETDGVILVVSFCLDDYATDP
jgi:hypothetical protein